MFTLDRHRTSSATRRNYKEADFPFGSESLWCVGGWGGASAHTWQLKNLMRLLLHTSSSSLYSSGDSAHWYTVRLNWANLGDKQVWQQMLSWQAIRFRCPKENQWGAKSVYRLPWKKKKKLCRDWDKHARVWKRMPQSLFFFFYNQTSQFTINRVSIIQADTLRSSTSWKRGWLQCSNLISSDYKTRPSPKIKEAVLITKGL